MIIDEETLNLLKRLASIGEDPNDLAATVDADPQEFEAFLSSQGLEDSATGRALLKALHSIVRLGQGEAVVKVPVIPAGSISLKVTPTKVAMTKPKVKPVLGFSAAKLFREESQKDFAKFLHRHLFFLCSTMELIATGGTVRFIKELLERPGHEGILFGPNHPVDTAADYEKWKAAVERSLTNAGDGTQGMVAITNGVVEETIAAIHHFTDREDIERSIYTRVLARQAIVHHVPIANDLRTASAMATAWLPLVADLGCPFQDRDVPHPLEGLAEGQKALALIAHDGKKLEICDFVVANAATIIDKYGLLITTGTTGTWIQRFLTSLGHKDFASKVILCNSGPDGGDVQIANAVCEGKCQDVIFFQDPGSSHPHDADIRLFEQAIYDKAGRAAATRLGRNWQTASIIIG